MRSTLGRIAALTATLVVALSLAACGGGGDGNDSIAIVPVVAPVALTPSWSNAPIPMGAGTEAAKQLAARGPLRNGAVAAPVDPYAGVDPFNAIEQLLDFGERNFRQYFPDNRATAVYEKFRYRYYPATGIYLGVAYAVTASDGLEESGIYVMGGPFGNSPAHVGTLRQYITPVTPWSYANWWNGTQVAIYPMGTKVVGANQLPQGCIEITQQCWKDSVLNGTVKLIETPAVMIGLSNGRDTRPIVFAYYITADGKRWNTLPVFRDSGESGGSSINGGGTFVISYAIGNELGNIFKVGEVCYQKKWYPAGDPSGNANIWTNEPVACP